MRRRAAVVFVLGLLGVLLPAGAARADGAPPGTDIQVAQTLGDRELTVILRRVDTTPGPMRVDVITHTVPHATSAPGTLTLRAARAGNVVSTATVTLGAQPGSHGATLRVDSPGPWELDVDDGREAGSIPFVVPAQVVAPWESATYGGFVAAGVFLLAALAVAVRARDGRWALLPAGGLIAALAVAVTGALLSRTTPPLPAPGSLLDPTVADVTDPYSALPRSTVDYSRPPVTLLVSAADARAGLATDVTLSLIDASSGRPADDLLVHDDALVHLLVGSPSGRLWHLHPVRVAPGRFRVRLTPPEPGRYAVSAELSRRGGGVQLARSTLDVDAGPTTPPAPVPAGPGERVVDGTPVDLTTTAPSAGTPTTVTARFPAADLQPWLGMLGHLIIAGPLPASGDPADAPVWAHAHAMVPLSPGMPAKPDETVAAFGPEVAFTYTFPEPGRYRLWAQVERGFTVLTVPAMLDVAPLVEGGTGR